MSWISRIFHDRIRTEPLLLEQKNSVPEGVWEKCEGCQAPIFRPELEANQMICPSCAYHYRITARARLNQFLDEGTSVELAGNICPVDVLKFKDTKRYEDRLKEAKEKSKETDALIVLKGNLKKIPIVTAAFEFGFLGGSMGSVVGERFVQAVNCCLVEKRALICFTASGGARMQESLFSLMQMAKVSAALGRLRQVGLPYFVVLTHPTTGGVSASLAMLGDIQIAEPNALIGFAGPRVIEQTVREVLPEGFQRSEFVLKTGMLDMIVDRRELPTVIASLLSKLQKRAEASEL